MPNPYHALLRRIVRAGADATGGALAAAADLVARLVAVRRLECAALLPAGTLAAWLPRSDLFARIDGALQGALGCPWPAGGHGDAPARLSARAVRAAEPLAVAALTEPNDDGIGWLYERFGAPERRAGGVFYTPPALAALVAAWACPAGGPGVAGALVDPACGVGACLAAVLIAAAARAEAALPPIRGVDRDPGAVQRARVHLRLCARQAGFALPADLPPDWPVACGDGLEALLAAAAGKAPRPAVVLGNPPFVPEEGHRSLLAAAAAHPELGRRRAARADLSHWFVHAALDALPPGGRLVFVLPGSIAEASAARELHRRLAEETCIEHYLDLCAAGLFGGARAAARYAVLATRLQRAPGHRARIYRLAGGDAEAALHALARGAPPPSMATHVAPPQAALLHATGRLKFGADADEARWDRFEANARPLAEAGFTLGQGLVANPNRLGPKALGGLDTASAACLRPLVGAGVFVLTPAELASLALPPEAHARFVRPFATAGALRPFLVRWPDTVVLFLTAQTCPHLDEWPSLAAHLERFRPLLESRREVRLGVRAWFHLHWPRRPELFAGPRLVVARQAPRPVAAVCAADGVFDLSTVIVRAPEMRRLWALAGVLQTGLAAAYFAARGKRKATMLQVDQDVLAGFPLPRRFEEHVPALAAAAEAVAADVESTAAWQRLEEVVAAAYDPPAGLTARAESAAFPPGRQ